MKLLPLIRWMAGVQSGLAGSAWRARSSPGHRADFYRLRHAIWPHTPANALPVRTAEEVFPGITCDVELRVGAFDFQHRYYRLYTHHACLLASLVKYLQPSRIFEFGTYKGEMTVNLALNAPPDGEVFTLDLAPGESGTALPIDGNDVGLIRFRRAEDALDQLPEGCARVTRLFGDSARFDPAPFEGSCDFIYVDGAHSYEYAKNDSRHAFRMLRPGGVILWDDHGRGWPGVSRCLREEARRRPIYHLEHTLLAVYRDMPPTGGNPRLERTGN